MFSAALLMICSANATTYARALDLDALSAEADRIVSGEVIDVAAELTDQGLIETVATVVVDEVLHGRPSEEIHVRVLGGSVNGLELTVPGSPVFEAGQEVLIFVDGERVVGFGQGAFLIDHDVAWRGLGNHVVVPSGNAVPNSFRLSDIRQSIR